MQSNNEIELMSQNLLKIQRQLTQNNEQQSAQKIPRGLTQKISRKSTRNKPVISDYKSHQNEQEIKYQTYQQLAHSITNPNTLINLDEDQLQENIKQIYSNYLIAKQFPSNHQQKLQILLNQQITLGTTIALFQMVYYFRQILSQEIIYEISYKSFQKLTNLRISSLLPQEIRSLCQLIALCGVGNQEIISYFLKNMLQGSLKFQLCYLVLVNLGYEGIYSLVNIANKEMLSDLPMKILDNLCRSEYAIKSVIIPYLLADLAQVTTSQHTIKQKCIALAALNRLGDIVGEDQRVLKLIQDILQGKYPSSQSSSSNSNCLQKGPLVSVLRSSGIQGQKILLSLARKHFKNQQFLLPIISILPWRVKPQPILRLKVIEHSIGGGFLPGTLYQYEGSIQPSAFQYNKPGQVCCDSLCLNSTDFLAALNRLFVMYQKSQQYNQQEKVSSSQTFNLPQKPFFRESGIFNHKNMFILYSVICQKQDNQIEFEQTSKQNKIQISGEVIKLIESCLSHKSSLIKQTALNSIGLVGLPEAQKCIQKVSKFLQSTQSNIRSMACWTISKLLCNCEQKIPAKVMQKLSQLLKDNFWKVRTSACITISSIINCPNEQIITNLLKCLKDGSINKFAICQCFIKMGQIGQEILLQILKNTGVNDFKLKQAIISSFKLLDLQVTSGTIVDLAIEQIFKNCKAKDSKIQIRALCLETLNILRVKFAQLQKRKIFTQQQKENRRQNSNYAITQNSNIKTKKQLIRKTKMITYLQGKNILPLYYFFLEDNSPKIRQLAMQSILSFGSQAELIFIEGLTRGTPLVRCQSAKALGKLGVQNFRALLLGLKDEELKVIKAASQSLLENFNPQQVYDYFIEKTNLIPSVICSLESILRIENQNIDYEVKRFITEVLYRFQVQLQRNQEQSQKIELAIPYLRQEDKQQHSDQNGDQDRQQELYNHMQRYNQQSVCELFNTKFKRGEFNY